MSAKYVFLDVDGTLVNFQSKIPDSAIEALTTAQKNGHKMILATGRQKSQIYPWLLEKVHFDGILGCSGAYLEYDGKQIFESVCSPDKLAFIIDFFHNHNIFYCLQSRDALYAEKDDLGKIRKFMTERGNPPEVIDSVIGCAKITNDPKSLKVIEKLAYYDSPFGINEISEYIGDYFEVVSYSLGKPQDGECESYHGEINFNGINKATGIKKFMETVNAPLYDTIAVGDSGNDLEMIKFANVGVAMGNASNDVKAAADIITADIDSDGIYNAFKTLNLI